MTRSPAALLAMPGDSDLDADVDGLTVTAVVHNAGTRELLVRLADGHGHFIDTTGQRQEFAPGSPSRRVQHVELSARLPAMPDKPWVDYVGLLERWRDQATPLRMCAAPGRVTLLIEDRSTFLPFPRRSDPGATL